MTVNPQQFFSTPFGAQADNSMIATIPTTTNTAGRASMTTGFPLLTMIPRDSGGIPPTGADMNGILNMLALSAQAAELGMIWPFSASYAATIGGYPIGATVAHPTAAGRFLVCTQAGNANDPAQNMAGWLDPMAGFANTQDVAQNYATSSTVQNLTTALASEVQRASNAENGKVSKTGDTITGDQVFDNGNGASAWASSPQTIFRLGGHVVRIFGQITGDGDIQIDLGGEDKNMWAFRPDKGTLASPNGGIYPEIVGLNGPTAGTGRIVEQVFTVTGQTSGGNTESTVTFPTPFAPGTVPILAITINREPSTNVSRGVSLGNISGQNQPNVTNTGFSFQPWYATAEGINTSGQPWTLHVRAIGTM